jgi:hypothetical protein
MIGRGALSPARVVERIPGSARIALFRAKHRARPEPAPGPVPAPPGDNILRTRSGSVELVMSYAGASVRNFCGEAAFALASSLFWLIIPSALLFPVVALAGVTMRSDAYSVFLLALGSAALLYFAVLFLLQLPRVLRIGFAPAARPVKVRVVRWWPTRRIKLSALSAITIIEYRYRQVGENAAGDAQRETISRLPYRIDVVLHRVDGRSRTVEGKGHQGWKPDTRDVYGPLGDLLAPAGLTIGRQVKWAREPRVSSSGYFSPGSGGANGLGGGC